MPGRYSAKYLPAGEEYGRSRRAECGGCRYCGKLDGGALIFNAEVDAGNKKKRNTYITKETVNVRSRNVRT